MKNTTKLLCILLSLLFVFGAVVLPAAAADASGALTDTASWSFAGGTFTVRGAGEIPDDVLAAAVSPYKSQIKRVVVENGVVSLGRRAFLWCDALESVSLPGSMKRISNDCFCGCPALKKIDIPGGVQVIGSGAFMDCASLKSVTLPASLHVIESDAFRGCTSLKEIRFPSSLCYIGFEAFMASGLTSVTLPGSVRALDGWAFSQCKSLTHAVLSPGLTMLCDCVFQNSALEYVVIPKSIRSVSDAAFYNCTLKEIYYEGTEAEFKAIDIIGGSDLLNVSGTTEKLFNTAALHIQYDGLLSRGDMDEKDGVTTGDARKVLRTAVALDAVAPATYDFYRADVNSDGDITTADARLVLRGAVALEDLTKLAPPRPKTYTEKELKALEAFQGTLTELLQQYDVPQLYGLGSRIAVFPGENRTVALLFTSDGALYNVCSASPKNTLAELMKFKQGDDINAVMAKEPTAANGIYAALGQYSPYAILAATTDGHTVIFSFYNSALSGLAVY